MVNDDNIWLIKLLSKRPDSGANPPAPRVHRAAAPLRPAETGLSTSPSQTFKGGTTNHRKTIAKP